MRNHHFGKQIAQRVENCRLEEPREEKKVYIGSVYWDIKDL